MGYTAIEEMRRKNQETFGFDTGPHQPEFTGIEGYDLKGSALRFLHDRCEGLMFDGVKTAKERADGIFLGKSLKAGQIPYNMQMDINRLCLERELEAFIESGNAEDAYTVYYSFFGIFFGDRYGRHKKMIELLSEYELNGASIVMKHRDHYSHSVYVFAMGLAIYETNEHFRKAYKKFYHFEDGGSDTDNDRRAAHHFLLHWGMTALYHDIGYTFELPYEQIVSYFTETTGQKRGENTPYLLYNNMDHVIDLSAEEKEHFRKMFGRSFSSIEEVLAHAVTNILGKDYGFSEEYIREKIHNEPVAPEKSGFKMDHAYFSAVRLFREMADSPAGLSVFTKEFLDVLGAIVLHNRLFIKEIAFCEAEDLNARKAPLRMEVYPLAYLLFFCDVVQVWDRTSYGRSTRLEMHPVSVDLDLRNNAFRAVFNFDREEQEKIDLYLSRYRQWELTGEQGERPRLKDYGDMTEKEARFKNEVEAIVDTSEMPFTLSTCVKDADRSHKHVYLSSSSFLHLYDFAVVLNGRYAHHGTESDVSTEQLEEEFESCSLEYQLSNINQARSFAKYLNALGYFYTDKPVDYDMLPEITAEQAELIGPMEHERWIREKAAMGWHYGADYRFIPLEKVPFAEGKDEKTVRTMLREQFRMHELALDGAPSSEEIREHYFGLVKSEQEKDYRPFNSMLKLIKKYDGLRIYRLPK